MCAVLEIKRMKKLVFLLIPILTLINSAAFGQNKSELDKLLRNNQEVPKVLLVGTFHFGYPGLDDHKTEDAYKVDINSPERQKEVQDLVDYIAQYQPTKILVEAGNNTRSLMQQYRAWKAGNVALRKREIDQIGFRLMRRFQLDTLYGIDANSFVREIVQSRDSIYIKPILDRIYKQQPDSLYESTFDDQYWEWYKLQDRRTVEMHLLDYFKKLNSEHHINRMHGHYILSDKTKNYNGVDGLILNWYSRNLRIFKNIQMVGATPSDRILVLIGAGHVPILQQQFESSPEYELVRFWNLKPL